MGTSHKNLLQPTPSEMMSKKFLLTVFFFAKVSNALVMHSVDELVKKGDAKDPKSTVKNLQANVKPTKECKDAVKPTLYEAYVYKPQCMQPPLNTNIEHCPIDDREVLVDGTTKAVPY